MGDKFESEDTNLVVFGSMARGEWIDWLSDLDWTFLIDGQCKPLHFQIAQDIRDALKKERREKNIREDADGKWEYRFAEPGPTGTFGNMGFSHQLIHLIGGQEDTNKNTTQRMLLLLESLAVGSETGAHQRVLTEIVHRYLDEETHLVTRDGSRFKVPRFLLNDIVRFWRTMAVDFASKQRDRRGQGWALRNAKLRMSRKLIFAAGLLTCFSCQLDEELQAKISTDKSDIKGARSLNLVDLQEHIIRRLSATPIDVVAQATIEYKIEKAVAKDLFDAYDDFLGMMSDVDKRSRLKELKPEKSRDDETFKEVQDFSERFSRALKKIFFGSQLNDLTQEYGAF